MVRPSPVHRVCRTRSMQDSIRFWYKQQHPSRQSERRETRGYKSSVSAFSGAFSWKLRKREAKQGDHGFYRPGYVERKQSTRCSISIDPGPHRVLVVVRENSAICSAMTRPISSEAVAAGEGALHTWIAFGPVTIMKSSTRVPSGRIAWARTPAPPGTRSSSWTSGIRLCKLRTKAFLLNERWISASPDLACFAARRQNPP